MSKINPLPKRLTLKQALNATNSPIKRLGDLIAVQAHRQLLSHTDFQNGEMRSVFMPSRDAEVMKFPQPSTEIFLIESYRNGGWIESLGVFG